MRTSKHSEVLRKLGAAAGFLCILLAVIFALDLFLPAYAGLQRGTRIFNEMREEDETDIIFLGASLFNRAIDADALTEALGRDCQSICFAGTAYIQQYFVLKELLKHQTPKLVVLNVSVYQFSVDRSGSKWVSDLIAAYPPGIDKLKFLFAGCAPSRYINVMVPRIAMFSFSDVLTTQVLVAATEEDESSDNSDAKATEETVRPEYAGELQTPNKWRKDSVLKYVDNTQKFLQKSIDLCKAKGVDVVLMSTPIPYFTLQSQKKTYEEYIRYLKELATKNNVELALFELIQRDLLIPQEMDFVDFKHLSSYGTEKFTVVAAQYLNDYLHGTLDADLYFYPSLNALMDEADTVFCTFGTYQAKKKYLDVYSFQGTNVIPEYKVAYRLQGTDEWVDLTGFTEDTRIDLSKLDLLPGDSLQIEARNKFGDEVAVQYYELTITD